MGRQPKRIEGLALLALIMFGALSIMVTGCGDGGDGNDTTINQQTLVATWDITASSVSGLTQTGTISLAAEGALTYELFQLNLNQPGQKPLILIGTGTWTFDEPSLTLTFDTGVILQGIPQGNSTDFSMVCSNVWTLNFSRK